MTNNAKSEAGIPFFRKSDAPMNRWPSLFSCVILIISFWMLQRCRETYAVILGKPETGSPIPAEQIKAVAYPVSFSHAFEQERTMINNLG
jgi:hypothetical protein